jgi:beta-fructofuranosidase
LRRREFLSLAAAPLAAGPLAKKLAADPQRPQYHLLPPANWMNDPNGPIYWQGHYHMFYQYNPNGAFWGDMHWGHAISPDMVHWKHLPMALAPTPGGPDKDGVFSGCAVIDGGVPTAIYTGVNPEVQCLATSSGDLVKWRKYEHNPIIAGPPPGLAVAGFRDPAVWQEGGTWLMALGSGFRGQGGAVLLYASPDLRRWRYLHPLVTGQMRSGGAPAGGAAKDPVDTGEMWECPDFFPLDGKHVLILSTERIVKYMVGSYTDRRFHPETHGLVDFGAYYAARTMTNTGSRRILWGWITERRSVAEQRAAGWSGAMSLPRVLSLSRDGRLQFRPAAEVEKLRARRLESHAAGDSVEILAEIHPGDARRAGLKLAHTLLYYDRPAQRLTVDAGPSGAFQLADGEPLRLHVFVDGSVIEIFANDRACLTARVYPTAPAATAAQLYAAGGKARVVSMEAWQLRPISPDRLTS